MNEKKKEHIKINLMASITTDVDKIDTLLASPTFDPIAFINELLPDESSLSGLDECISKLKIRSGHISSSIREAVHSYSVLGDSSEVILNQTQNSIVDLAKRIADIHDQATDTEKIVSQFCDDIKPLNNAKQNLQQSIAAINRLEMIPKSIKELEDNINKSNYSECATHILALSSLFESFDKYSKMDQINPLQTKFFDLKRLLRNKINTELDSKFFRGSADETNIPICKAIDAFQDDFRSSTIELFCDKFLGPYDDAYRTSPLSDIKKRFHWFKQRIDFFNRQYSSGFPQEWKMEYHITTSFCAKTTQHLLQILSVTPNVKDYLFAFEYTVKFEQKMAQAFATQDVVYIDKDAPVPEFEDNPDGIRDKYKFIFDRDNHVGHKVLVPAKEFIGMIAKAFAPHLDLYLQAERENLDKIIQTVGQNLKEDIDPSLHVLTSSTTLIMGMKKTIEKCAGFDIPQSLLDLFLIIKELIIKYAATLTRILPNKPKKNEQYQTICAIANTSAQILNIIQSLSDKVIDLVPDDTKPAINVEDARDSVGGELKKQLMYLGDVIVKECEIYLIQIGNNQWQGNDDDNETSEDTNTSRSIFSSSVFSGLIKDLGNNNNGSGRYSNLKIPAKLMQILDDRFLLLDEWLTPDNFNRLRTTFIPKMVLVVHDSLFKSKSAASQANAVRTLQSAKELKQVLIECTKADSKIAKKRVEAEFAQIEAELTILCCPDVAMVGTYLAKAKTPSKEHFLSILKLRGIEDVAQYSAEYDRISSSQKLDEPYM